MADSFEWGTGLTIKLDASDSTAALVDISDYVNSQAMRTAFDVFRTEGVGSSDPERQHGMADLSVPLNGWVNSTTEAMFGPLVGSRTSVTKTFAYGTGVPKNSTSDWWYTGEVLPTDGLAARTIKSDFWNPPRRLSRSLNPLEIPLSFPFSR